MFSNELEAVQECKCDFAAFRSRVSRERERETKRERERERERKKKRGGKTQEAHYTQPDIHAETIPRSKYEKHFRTINFEWPLKST